MWKVFFSPVCHVELIVFSLACPGVSLTNLLNLLGQGPVQLSISRSSALNQQDLFMTRILVCWFQAEIEFLW